MLFITRRQRVPEPVQRLTQRRAPLLVPPAVIANFTSTIRSPALHAVHAAPRGVLRDLDLVGRRKFLQIFAVDGHPREIVGNDMMQAIGQAHFTETVMMAVSLAVGGDMNELRMVLVARKNAQQPVREIDAAFQEIRERHFLSNGPVVKE